MDKWMLAVSKIKEEREPNSRIVQLMKNKALRIFHGISDSSCSCDDQDSSCLLQWLTDSGVGIATLRRHHLRKSLKQASGQ
jgi:hypothetical protein